MSSTDLQVADAPTLAAVWRSRVEQTPDRAAYRAFDEASGQWQTLTWALADQRVSRWRDALAALALPAGSRVAILLPNGLDAMCIDQACLALALVPVPLHAIDNPASIGYVLEDSGSALLVVAQRKQWAAIAQAGVAARALRQVVVTGDDTAPGVDLAGLPAARVPVVRLADWLAAGVPSGNHPGPKPEDLAALVYTSGTTGRPKGVKLSHRNVVANLRAVLGRVQPRIDDVFLSFLPLSHTFERTAGYYLPIAAGSCVCYARSVTQLADDLLEQQPTVLISVPRIYERVHAKLAEAVAGSPLKARLMEAAVAVGWRRFRASQGLAPDADGRPRLLDALYWPLLDRLVARPMRARFGGCVRVAVSGGAALPPAVARTFLGLGLPVLQGYGMTETSPVVAANGLDDNDPSSVGRALDGVEVRIGDNRELQVRGPSVMQGYWHREEDTARIIDADGWLATGDQAEIIDGRIFIRGRIKEIIVTSTGEKVPPVDLELALCEDPLIEQAFVVGEHKPFIGAVVVLNADEWRRLAFSLGLDWQAPASLSNEAAREAVLKRLEQRAAHFPRYAVPRAVVLSLEPWTVENTLLTPTLKLKRLNLQARFEQELAAMYAARARA